MSAKLGRNVRFVSPNGYKKGRVIAQHHEDKEVFIVQDSDGSLSRVHEDDIKAIFPKLIAAWGVVNGKIIIGDTKDNEPYAVNSFKNHAGIAPVDVITYEG